MEAKGLEIARLMELGRLSEFHFKSPNEKRARLMERHAEQSRVVKEAYSPAVTKKISSTSTLLPTTTTDPFVQIFRGVFAFQRFKSRLSTCTTTATFQKPSDT